jgi:hypothetical protein
MSRGLGKLQRGILAAYEQLATTEAVERQVLRALVAQAYPSGPSFEAAFSRALRGLCQRGILVPRASCGTPYHWRGAHIRTVRRSTEDWDD